MTEVGREGHSLPGGPLPALPSYASGPSATPLLGDTVGENLRRTAARFPGNEALVDVPSGRRWTYSALASAVERLACGLLDGGIEPGDRVGIWAPNCPEWVVLQFATASIGAILVTINPAYRTHELEFVLNQAGIRHLVAVSAFKTSDYEAMLADVGPRCAQLRDVTIIGSAGWDAVAERTPTRRASPRWPLVSRRTTPSTSSTRRGRRASPRAPRSATTTS